VELAIKVEYLARTEVAILCSTRGVFGIVTVEALIPVIGFARALLLK